MYTKFDDRHILYTRKHFSFHLLLGYTNDERKELRYCMIDTLRGELLAKKEQYVVIEVAGIGFRVFAPKMVLAKLPQVGSVATLYCVMNVKQDGVELCGFSNESEKKTFEMLTSVSGVGAKTAMRILDIAGLNELAAAVNEGRAELLTTASGVGRKTAERIVVELRGRLTGGEGGEVVRAMEANVDITDALANLGYHRGDIREALKKIDPQMVKLEDRVRAAMKLLKK